MPELPKLPEPLFVHDCNKCEYLGVVTDGRGIPFDAYVCPQGLLSAEFVARRSDEGSDYWSANSSAWEYKDLPVMLQQVVDLYRLRCNRSLIVKV